MSTKDYQRAVTQYDLALGLKKDHAGVQAKRKEAQRLLEEQLKNAENEKKYQAKMTEALAAYKGKDWQNALKLYKEARDIKPSEQDPRDKNCRDPKEVR